MDKTSRIYVAGHRGLVGSAITRELERQGYMNLLKRTSNELDLRNQQSADDFFNKEIPEYVFIAAAKVGGIGANSKYAADFITDNLLIQTNIICASHRTGVKKLLFMGSSCIYPKFAPTPITEDCLFDGKLEPTNESYAVAKIAGLMMCKAYRQQYSDNYIAVMPTNLYGPGDNFDLESSHVLPAMIRKFHNAKIEEEKSVTLWGTGNPLREFLHVDDLARACIYLMNNYNGETILNVGTGIDLTIKQLAETVKEIVGYKGDILWDHSKPDGTLRKLLDISKISSTGWKPEIELKDGIRDTYTRYCQKLEKRGV